MPSLIKLLPYTLRHLKWITNKILLYTAQVTLLNIMWWAEWEGSLGENGYVNMYVNMNTYPKEKEMTSDDDLDHGIFD